MKLQRDKGHFIRATTMSHQKVSVFFLKMTLFQFIKFQVTEVKAKTYSLSFSSTEIIELVKRPPPQYGVPFRPTINDQTFDDLNNIMTKCWKEDPNERPDFNILKATIRKVNK